MTVLTIILLVMIGGMLALLLPRFRLICSFGNGESVIEVDIFWFSVAVDLRTSSASGRILFFRFKKVNSEETQDETEKPMIKTSPSKSTTDQSPYPDHDFHDYESTEPTPTPRIKIKRKAKRTKVKPAQQPTSQKEKKPPMWRQVWRERSLMWRLIKYFVTVSKRLITAFRIDYFRSHVVFASSDPALTGMLYGYMTPLTALNNPPRRSITFDYDFDSEVPNGEISCSVSIRPINVLYIFLVETLRLPWLQIIRVVRQLRKRG